jgi:hypothetical protein
MVVEALEAPQPHEPLSRTLRTLPEAMDRQAYLTLNEHAKKLQLRIIYLERFLQDHRLLEAFQESLRHA